MAIVIQYLKREREKKKTEKKWPVELTHDGVLRRLQDGLDGEGLRLLGSGCLSRSLGRRRDGQLFVREPRHHERGALALR